MFSTSSAPDAMTEMANKIKLLEESLVGLLQEVNFLQEKINSTHVTLQSEKKNGRNLEERLKKSMYGTVNSKNP